ncbi:phosphatase PAP2 family protein [Caloranaerobacter sp. TR13]|uniref:phosphatase PAP2 family protein n=1 Tax=Caloranaerobacter sp. TR13 TaxID=1302151 RepID=UPI0006D3EFA1|nr:phosphatase PAP2 family protein [Caloranaerobacter sp. TR13]
MKEIFINFVQIIQRYGVVGLAVLSFAESSFFPIPPDVLLIPMALMNRKFALFYALVTTISSVFGGIFGHIMGRRFGKPLLKRFIKNEKLNKVQEYFEKYGVRAIVVAGFTPVPYKVFTLSSGAFNVKIVSLVIASIIGRGARFFLEGFFIFLFGDTSKYYLENYFEFITVAVATLYVLIYYIWNKKKSIEKVGNTEVLINIKRIFNKLRIFTLKYNKYDETVRYFLISILSLFIFSAMIEDYLTIGNWKFDALAFSYVYSIRNTILNNVFKMLSITGNFISVMLITLIISFILIYFKKRNDAIFFSLNTLVGWGLNQILKIIFKRPRLSGLWLVKASGYSFPSGHAMVFMGFSFLLIYYVFNYIKNKKFAVAISTFIFIYSIFVGLSRIYVGVHYLSDILAGWIAGTFWASSSIVIYKGLCYKKQTLWRKKQSL